MISERLKEERKRLGHNQDGLAGVAGVSRRAYADWESGKTSPTAAQLAAMYSVGADVQYIVTGVRSDMALTPDERDLLALFRAAPLAVKAAAVGALREGTHTAGARTIIHGDVGGQVENNSAPITINMGRKKK
ncbi:MAG TPA: helix-turn-helix domain-containing protein [Rhodocyclaceae bacterium]|nr:helix-turn-helix domain-containing protein [Rhodocyclaceae bacterium]